MGATSLQDVSDEQREAFRRALVERLAEVLARRRVAYLRVDYEPMDIIRAALDRVDIPWDNLGKPFGFRKSVTRVTFDGLEPPPALR